MERASFTPREVELLALAVASAAGLLACTSAQLQPPAAVQVLKLERVRKVVDGVVDLPMIGSPNALLAGW